MDLYPAIDIRGGRCVRLRQGDYDDETVYGEDPVAHAVVSVGAGESHLLNLCVRRDVQGRGYGRVLAVHVMGRARTRGASAMFLEVRPSNLVAAGLYESLGFREIGIRKNYYPAQVGHEDARVLALDLDAHFRSDRL